MYINFARPLRLFDPILLILKTADTRIEDVCEAVWRQLLHAPPSDERELPPNVTMGEIIVDLCRKYFPSEAAPSGMFANLPLLMPLSDVGLNRFDHPSNIV